MQKVLAKKRFSEYNLAMTANNHKQFAIYQGQLVIIEEVFDDTAFISFNDGGEKEVNLSELESA